MVSPTTCCMQMSVAGLALVVQSISLLFGQTRAADQQIVATNHRTISHMVEAQLSLPKLTETNQAIRVWNVATHIRLNAMLAEHMYRMCLV